MRTNITFLLLAVCLGFGCHTEEELSEYFDFSISEASISADGVSVFKLTAGLPEDTDEGIQSIVFASDASSGITSLQNGTHTVTKTIGLDKTASALFVSNVLPGYYTMTACVTLNDKTYCEEVEIETTPVPNEGLSLRIVEEPDQWIADGSSVISMDVMVRFFDLNNRKLSISYSEGVTLLSADAPDDQTLNVLGEKRLTFVTGDESKDVRMQFSYAEFELDTIITLQPSYPDQMILLSSADTYDLGSEVDLRIFLDRQGEGVVSRNLDVVATAYQLTDDGKVEVGTFDPPFLKTGVSMSNTASAEVTFDVGAGTHIDTLLPIWIKTELATPMGVAIIADSLSLPYHQ